ncbi:SSrecog-domain-containing protein [Ceraceosorus guamensis]|uniref:FACT complex subunit POB3 n=1 Tax=Ceraceosorus guamensis TaxID=1522189 RepID=A0A316W141_9BASI|nr:SSrecog-domain-containing protein [Ceraceosorus guamensis]PWN43566.1 SSrecog-domain-containing protein [Ceraceosorus guamensis]
MSVHAQFENIFYGLDSTAGRMRISAGGLGWKGTPADGQPAKTITIEADLMKSFNWTKVARGYQFRINLKQPRAPNTPPRETFDGFQREDYDHLAEKVTEYFSKSLDQVEISARGWNWGKTEVQDTDVRFLVRDKLAFEVPINHIANSNIAGKTEVSMEFLNPDEQQPEANTGSSASNGLKKPKKRVGDQLVEMRLHIPGLVEKDEDEEELSEAEGEGDGEKKGGGKKDEEEEEEHTKAAAFHDAIKEKADIGQVAGDSIIIFKDVLLLTPRGRFDIDMYPTFLRLRGKTYDYKVLYSSVTRLFLLPRPDDVHLQFVVGLDPGIRQGQTRYPYLVLQFIRDEEMDAELNLEEEEIESKYEGKLKKRYEDPTFKVVTTLFRVLTGQKLIAPGNDSFQSALASSAAPCVKCNVKATDGLLYPLDKQLIWVSKQPIQINYSDIHQVVFARIGGAVASAKTFDLKVVQRSGPEHTFQSITREEHDALNAHFTARKIRVKSEMNDADAAAAAADALLDDDDDDDLADIITDDEDEEEGGRKKSSGSGGKKSKKSRGADAMDVDEDEEDDEDFAASSSDGGSPSEASSDDEGAESGSDDMADSRPKKKKKSK